MSKRNSIDEAIRQQIRVHEISLDRFRIRAARSSYELTQAFSLLHEAYVGAKLQRADRLALRITAQHVLRESVVFVAWDEEQAAGTITVTLDSPAGLPLDKDYPEQMPLVRRSARRLAEVGSLAVRPAWRGTGLNVLLGFVSTWAVRRLLNASHLVIGVNPSHAALYRAAFGFATFGETRTHANLQAPVKGLLLDMAGFPGFVRQHYPRPFQNGRQVADEFCGVQPPSCVEVPGSLLQRDEALWKLPRRAFQKMFMQQSRHVYALDPATRRYLASQRSPDTLAQEALDA